jgi:glucan 1,3-beta-glucosidase
LASFTLASSFQIADIRWWIVIIDITDTTTAKVAGLHWQVAQATSLTNCFIYASDSADTTAMGMFTENGSSGFMGDCFFSGGAYGLCEYLVLSETASQTHDHVINFFPLDGGNQQYTVRGFEFIGQTTAGICLLVSTSQLPALPLVTLC